MAVFQYKMLNSEGILEKNTESLPLEVLDDAVRYLESHGGIVLNIRRIPAWINPVAQLPQYGFARIRRIDLAEMFNNLSMLLGAGINVLAALREVSLGMKNPRLLSIVRFMMVDISNGQTFSQAIARHGKVFSPIIYLLCKIGEETGKLDKMLGKIAEYLRHVDYILGETRRALIYPALVMAVISGAVIFWLWYVVPQVVVLFDDFGIEVPSITKFLVSLSSFVQNWFVPFAVLAVFLLVLLLFLKRFFYGVRYVLDGFILKIPIISDILITSSTARISENLGILTSSGVTVVRSLQIITDSIKNEVTKKRFQRVQHEIRLGNNLAGALHQASAVDSFTVRMIAVGEATSSLEKQALYVAKQYRLRLNNLIQNMSKTLEPALLLIMGLFFALMVAGLLFPLYDVIGNLGAF
ncbi:MAG: type II secretion system F family protein [Desulfonatronovibrio sp. MSAO_Bac4]|nr:MAG: type II secretion system F family protein [Desulfonatronovibrio sp. MSAO_Bac4]